MAYLNPYQRKKSEKPPLGPPLERFKFSDFFGEKGIFGGASAPAYEANIPALVHFGLLNRLEFAGVRRLHLGYFDFRASSFGILSDDDPGQGQGMAGQGYESRRPNCRKSTPALVCFPLHVGISKI